MRGKEEGKGGEAHREVDEQLSGLGGDLETENRAGNLRCPSVKMAAMASLQGSWCCLEWWGG